MSNRFTRGRGLFGNLRVGPAGSPAGYVILSKSNTVARTDTAAKNLFTLPANATIVGWVINGVAVSNAGTTATLSVGKSGGVGTFYLNAMDVKGATGAGQTFPQGAVGGAVGAAAQVVSGTYAETGAASTLGGPWTVTCLYTLA